MRHAKASRGAARQAPSTSPAASAARATAPKRRQLPPGLRWVLAALPAVLLGYAMQAWIRVEWASTRGGFRPPSRLTFRFGVWALDNLERLSAWLTPPDLRAMDIANGFAQSAIVHQSVRLGILDAFPTDVSNSKPCLSCEEVCASTPDLSRHVDWGCRLMASCASLGLLDYDPRQSCYSLTLLGNRFKQPATNGGFRELTLWTDGDLVRLWFDGVTRAVQQLDTEASPYEVTHGAEMWTHLRGEEHKRRGFHTYMAGVTAKLAPAVAEAARPLLQSASHVCDVGGAGHALMAAFMSRRPSLNASVFDLPEALEDASLGVQPDSQVKHWINRVAGSFFTRGDISAKLGQTCDLYVLKNILHDWADEDCVKILREVREAMATYATSTGRQARLLVVEGLLQGPEARGVMSRMERLYDMTMLVMLGRGRERSEAEFAALFEEAGLKLATSLTTSAPVAVLVVEEAH